MSDASATEHFDATPARVWEVLSDGELYADWVLGTKNIRQVEPGWPGEGTSIHFTVGIGPIEHKDRTTVRRCEPQRHLELEAHAWPLGTARIAVSIEPEGDGSRITMVEHPLRGPARVIHSSVTAVAFRVRCKVMIKNLRKVVEAH